MRMLSLMLTVLMLVAAPASAATPEQVETALNKAKAWLYAQQNADGNWEKSPKPISTERNNQSGGQWGGRTAIATYALLASGESPQDPRILRAVEFLKQADIQGIYAVAMRAQVWYFLPQTRETQHFMTRDAKFLLNNVQTKDDARGHYGYVPGVTGYSHSRSQYGLLGVWAAAQMGAEVPTAYWQLVESGWVNNIDRNGGWTYTHPKTSRYPVTPGMTAAGVASLYIVQDYLYATRGLDCRDPKPAPSDAAIQAGMKWLIANFDKVASDEPYERDFPYATIYAIERVGVASGQKYFGDIDWFQKGADWLIKMQEPNGSFKKNMSPYVGELPATCFAMLFLARGGAPVMMNKLEYTSDGGKPAAWSNRPRDAANAARWAGRTFERDLNWQIVNLRASPADLHDAPILYIAGSQALNFSQADRQKLREYVEQGGLILGHADCNSAAFTRSFRQLAHELFPAYAFRPLPDDHPIYTINYQRRNWRNPPAMQGLSNGARELMVLITNGDPGRAWQLMNVGGNEPAWELAVNLYLYATDRQIARLRGYTHIVAKDPRITPASKITVARVRHSGNWDPEPGGWRRLSDVMHNQHRVELTVTVIAPGEPIAAPVAHLTGTGKLTLDDGQKAAIRQFVESGGTLVIDAAGGDSTFASDAETLLADLFPQSQLQTLPGDHPLYAGVQKIEYRSAARRLLGNIDQPRLKGLTIGDRLAVIYSREDLSAGLVGQRVDGIIGYAPQTATTLMARILLHATAAK